MSQAGVWEQRSTGVAAQLEQRPEPSHLACTILEAVSQCSLLGPMMTS